MIMNEKSLVSSAKVILLLVFAFGFTAVFAGTGGGGGQLGLETPVQTLVDGLTGPWLFGVSTLAMVLALAQLAFGGELGAVGRSLIFLILIITLLINIVNVMQSLFGQGIVLSGANAVVVVALSLVLISYALSVVGNSFLRMLRSSLCRTD